MKCLKLLMPVLTLFQLSLGAQTISLDLPANAGLKTTLALKYGTQTDTVYQGNLDEHGRALISIPEAYKDYKGIAELRTDRIGSYFEFIVASENMSLHCKDEYIHGGNVVFKNSPENQSLQRWYMAQAVNLQKTALLQEAKKLYSSSDGIYPALHKEVQSLKLQQTLFEDSLRQSKLYAARFIEMRNFLQQRVAPLLVADSVQMASVREFVRDSLDVNTLFTSGMWFDTLNGLLALYDNSSPYHKYFTQDMAVLLSKSKSDRLYTSLAENLFAICESTGWNDLEEQLAYFLINDGRIHNPTGRLQMLMNLFKLAKGSKAPSLTQGELPQGKVLLVFYESGCGPCENELEMLKANHSLVNEKGIKVVSVSADTDRDVFKNTSEQFPWSDKYCDLKGFKGDDFKHYGVIGTPTFYMIDKNGIIQGRYARFVDTGLVD